MHVPRTPAPWRVPLLWRLLQVLARGLVAPLARVRISGDVPDDLRHGPLILAANHISPFDPIALTAACRLRRIAPRFMATGGLFRAPVVGAVMRRSGHIRVDRRTASVGQALPDAARALADRSVVLVYPEGRIGLDPGMWPERGKTGTARLAFASGATVVPVAQWGAHEVLPYRTSIGKVLRGIGRSMLRRPVIRVHFAAPVRLDDIDPAGAGAAQRATERIIDALTAALVPLRPHEPDLPRHVDATRPTQTVRARPRGTAGPPGMS